MAHRPVIVLVDHYPSTVLSHCNNRYTLDTHHTHSFEMKVGDQESRENPVIPLPPPLLLLVLDPDEVVLGVTPTWLLVRDCVSALADVLLDLVPPEVPPPVD